MKRRREEKNLTEEQMRAIERMTENAREVSGTCGCGYTLPSFPVHLHHSVMNEIERMDTPRGVEEWWNSL